MVVHFMYFVGGFDLSWSQKRYILVNAPVLSPTPIDGRKEI